VGTGVCLLGCRTEGVKQFNLLRPIIRRKKFALKFLLEIVLINCIIFRQRVCYKKLEQKFATNDQTTALLAIMARHSDNVKTEDVNRKEIKSSRTSAYIGDRH